MGDSPVLSRRAAPSRGASFILLCGLLACLYLIVYSARIETGDSLMLFDAVSSWVDHGDFRLDLALWHRPPPLVSDFDLVTHDIEPLQVWLSAPLYALARAVPWLGMIHTVWMFNVILCALAGGVLFLYADALGFARRTALAAGLGLGALTIVFPYSKSFFREPLMLLMLLLAALALEHLRRDGFRPSLWWAAAAGAGMGLLLTKASGVLALPALAIIALPVVRARWTRPLLIGGGLALVVGVGYLALCALGVVEGRYNVLARLDALASGYLGTALAGYLLSPNASVWGTSPIVLLALPGALVAVTMRRVRYPLAALALLAAFAGGYAALSAQHWFGGLSLPPRFLLPVLPFLLLAGLPALDRALHSTNTAIWAALALLVMYSAVWQLSSASFWWGEYAAVLPPESGGLSEWTTALYDLRYLRPLVMGVPLAGRTPDFAWALIGQPGWALAFGALALTFAAALRRGGRRAAFVLMLSLLIVGALYLAALYRADPRTDSQNDPLIAMLDAIDAEIGAGDALLLASPRYHAFFMNAYRGGARVIALPEQPGEQPSPQQPPQSRSDNPDMLLTPETIPLLHRLAAEHERLWLLVEFGPELAWSARPVERFMAAHYYPMRVIQTAPTVRLIEWDTAHAPDRFGFRGADIPTDLVYGGALRLLGITLPDGMAYAPGAALPVSLHWALDAPTRARYTVALFLRDADGAPVTQTDWQPGFGFDPTDTWTPGLPVWDHRALALPPDLAAGAYQLWVKVYDFVDGAPRDLPVMGAHTLDGRIGVLPVTVTVRAPE